MDMQQQAIRQVIEAADSAISAEDFDRLMDFYADDATLVVRPGLEAHGKTQIRKAYEGIAAHFGHHLNVRQGKIEIVHAGETALVLMESLLDTRVTNGTPHTITRRATYVFRRESDRWLCVVDNSYGTGLLDAAQVAGVEVEAEAA